MKSGVLVNWGKGGVLVSSGRKPLWGRLNRQIFREGVERAQTGDKKAWHQGQRGGMVVGLSQDWCTQDCSNLRQGERNGHREMGGGPTLRNIRMYKGAINTR